MDAAQVELGADTYILGENTAIKAIFKTATKELKMFNKNEKCEYKSDAS